MTKTKCDDFLFFQGKMKVKQSWQLLTRAAFSFFVGVLLLIRGVPEQLSMTFGLRRKPNKIACGVDYGRPGGIDLAHFPVLQDKHLLDKVLKLATVPQPSPLVVKTTKTYEDVVSESSEKNEEEAIWHFGTGPDGGRVK